MTKRSKTLSGWPPRLEVGAWVALVGCLCGFPAQAQLSPAAKLSAVAANQLGIIEYCHDKGFAGSDAVDAERKAFLGAPSTNLSTVPPEELGRQGFSVDPDGAQLTLAELAARQHTGVAALCKDLASAALQFQAALHAR